MTINKTDISKISIPEALSNSNGKTSASAILGSECITIGLLCFIIGIFYAGFKIPGFENILIQSLGLVGIGSAMIVTKKIKATDDKTNTEIEDVSIDGSSITTITETK